MKVLFASSEALPYFRTGGLSDAARSLADTLSRAGVDIRIIHPMYRTTAQRLPEDLPGSEATVRWPAGDVPVTFRLHEGAKGHADAVLVEQPSFFDTAQPYAPTPTDPLELGRRYAFFCRAVVTYAMRWGADLVHLNDWFTGLVPAYGLVDGLEAPTLFAIHNVAYQGNFAPTLLGQVGLPADLQRTENGVEFHGRTSFLKAGIALSDRIVTVSPAYAREMRTPEYGAGFDGLLRFRRRALYGILNGIDTSVWNPGNDPALPAHYGMKKLDGKDAVRKAVLEECGLEDGGPLLVMVTRLTWQKGVDIALHALPELVALGARVVVLGDGDSDLQHLLDQAVVRTPNRVAAIARFDDGLAHRLYAGGDFVLMPSRWEPCGLGQMIAQRYGTPPIVRQTGGLADTVEDGRTGFTFREANPAALYQAVARASAVWRGRGWTALRRRCMRLDRSWSHSAALYEELYRLTIGRLTG